VSALLYAIAPNQDLRTLYVQLGMAAPARSVVFRVTGLAIDRADAVVSSLTTVVNKHLSLSESAHLKYTVSAIPSCDDEHTSAALVTFQNGVPLFLNHLVEHPLADYPIETDDGDINFDRHFFGLTQLYYPDPAHPVEVE
jgi:protein SERAC1